MFFWPQRILELISKPRILRGGTIFIKNTRAHQVILPYQGLDSIRHMRDLKEVEKFLLPPTMVAVVDALWWVAGFPLLPVVASLSSVYVVIDLTIGFVVL